MEQTNVINFNFKMKHKIFYFICFVLLCFVLSKFKAEPIYYNNSKHIENSYQVIGIKNKLDYIEQNNIEFYSKIDKASLVFEWEWHNLIYYLDIFKIFDSHTISVDFGN